MMMTAMLERAMGHWFQIRGELFDAAGAAVAGAGEHLRRGPRTAGIRGAQWATAVPGGGDDACRGIGPALHSIWRGRRMEGCGMRNAVHCRSIVDASPRPNLGQTRRAVETCQRIPHEVGGSNNADRRARKVGCLSHGRKRG